MIKMNRICRIKLITLLLICFPNALLFSAQAVEKIKIVTTLFPLYEFAQSVSGERGDVVLLLPPGAEIHTWKPKPSDIIEIARADLFIAVGSVLEPWLEDILKSVKNPELRILEASSGFEWEEEEDSIGDRTHGHESGDPHIWLDFKFDMQIIGQISSILTQMDPFYEKMYAENAHGITQKLKDLESLYAKELADCSLRTFIFGGHSAFGYIAHNYGLNQVAVYGLNPDSLPSPRRLVETIQIAKEERVNAIFYEAMLSDEIARMIAEEVGCQTLMLNPGATLSREELRSGVSFFDIMKQNLENLKIGLRRK